MAIETMLEDGILQIVLSNPSRGNSFGIQSAEAVAAALKKHFPSPKKNGKSQGQKVKSCRGLILTAKGRLFCAGGDLTDYAQLERASEGKKINRRITEILDQISQLPIPTVCLVSGDCFGGGVELISAFDKVLSVPEAMFGLWQRRMGLTFGWGGGSRLIQRLSPANLRLLAIEARSFSAFEALRIGLIDEIHVSSQITFYAREWLRKQTRQMDSVSAFKALIEKPSSEQIIFESLWWTPVHRAVLEKRRKK